MKKRLSFLIIFVFVCTVILSFSGCRAVGSDTKEKVFTKSGMVITLTSDFEEQEIVTQTALYVSQKAIVTVLKEDGSAIPDYGIKDYAELVCRLNKLDDDKVVLKDGYAEFTYEKEVNGKDFYYYARCIKNGTDFWLIQFACETKNAEAYAETFDHWASSVRFVGKK